MTQAMVWYYRWGMADRMREPEVAWLTCFHLRANRANLNWRRLFPSIHWHPKSPVACGPTATHTPILARFMGLLTEIDPLI